MKVKELIKKLQKENPEAEIIIDTDNDGYLDVDHLYSEFLFNAEHREVVEKSDADEDEHKGYVDCVVIYTAG